MAKRLTKDDWRARKVFNSHGICERGGKGLFVSYSAEIRGRAYRRACWQVVRPGYKTDPNAHWTDHYNKTFAVYRREDKEPKRLEAIEWASYVYAITGEWERDPWGDYHPAGALEAAREATEAALAGVGTASDTML